MEIKFRAWDVERKRMCKVIGFWPCENGSIAVQSLHELTGQIILHTGNPPGQFVLDQFAGLHDKEGVEIYDGDILVSNNKLHEVKWVDAGFNILMGERFKVVGNVHENPELLEGASDEHNTEK